MVAPSRPRAAVLILVVLIAGCGGSTATPASPATGGAATLEPSAPAAGSIDAATLIGCFGLGEADCRRVLEAAAGAVDPTAPVTYVQVGPFGCPVAAGCEASLVARPAGSVTVELADGPPIAMSVELGAGGSLEIVPAEAFTVEVEPSSVAGGLAGPVPFSLGHCGLGSGIDIDGSWWDPVGIVNSDHGDAINAADGTLAPVGPNQATFTSAGGFSVALVRHRGVKHLPLCQ
jgi:hypothetical protein